MRCKPGDLAIVTRGPNVGRICKVLERSMLPGHDWLCEAMQTFYLGMCFGDRVRGCQDHPAGTRFNSTDTVLRPLRDGDGEDEILRIAGYPACNNQPEHA